MQTIFLVWYGSYNDRGISGAYSSREAAELAAGDDNEIEEMALDLGDKERRQGLKCFQVKVYMDGTVSTVLGFLTPLEDSKYTTTATRGTIGTQSLSWSTCYEFWGWCQTEEEAVKLARKAAGDVSTWPDLHTEVNRNYQDRARQAKVGGDS